jgi:replicative superfamily II helicase
MKDYRIKEVINKNESRFYVQFYWVYKWHDFKHRMDGVYNVYDTLIKAQDCIKEMRDKETTDIKYHY